MKKDRIVFLDAGTVDFGDIDWVAIRCLGYFKKYELTKPTEISKRIRGVPIVITNKCRFDRAQLCEARDLACLNISATGTNNVDLKAATRRNIAVTNVPGYSTETMVQSTFAFILALAGRLKSLDQAVHAGAWSRSSFFTLADPGIREIHGKTLGILGYGTIGERVAQVAKAFGMRVLIGRIPGRSYSKGEKPKRVSFQTVIRHADFLTLHTPLTPLTQNLINDRVLGMMKPGAYLINTARGGIVNESALRKALVSGHLAGAAVDVLTEEPPPKRHLLFGVRNLLLTPHAAWASREVRRRLIHEVASNIRAFQRGQRRNRIV